jgi:hypothetical protein
MEKVFRVWDIKTKRYLDLNSRHEYSTEAAITKSGS